jgi:uncharacterized protein (DUF2147 family)
MRFLMMVFLCGLLPASLFANDVAGTWMTIDDETGKARSHIEIWIDNGVAYGKVSRIIAIQPGENTDPICTLCKGDDKDKKVVGLIILRGLTLDGDEWRGGTILDPNNGKTYKCKIKAEDGGQILKVRGFLGISLFGRTQIWKKLK